MRKIIGFKLAVRVKEVQRRAKKARFDLLSSGFGEPELQPIVATALKSIHPGVLFETFAHPDADQPLLSPIPGLAYSLVLATLGPGVEAARTAAGRENPAQLPLWSFIEEAALEEAVRFATALLEDEAAKEACELSPISALGGPEPLALVVRKLEGSKIGVAVDSGTLSPPATLACSLSWLAKSKKKK